MHKCGFFHAKQSPGLLRTLRTPHDEDCKAPRVLELVYTACHMKPFAEDIGYHSEPSIWDEEHRAHLRPELDTRNVRSYARTHNELRYVLDPKEVHCDGFPGETFRMLKENEIKQGGEYRTRGLVLERWDEMQV